MTFLNKLNKILLTTCHNIYITVQIFCNIYFDLFFYILNKLSKLLLSN